MPANWKRSVFIPIPKKGTARECSNYHTVALISHASKVMLKILHRVLCAQSLSCVQLFVTPWTVAHQAPLSMDFPRQEYWSGLPLPFPVDLPDPGIKPGSPALQVDSLPSEPPMTPLDLRTKKLGSKAEEGNRL